MNNPQELYWAEKFNRSNWWQLFKPILYRIQLAYSFKRKYKQKPYLLEMSVCFQYQEETNYRYVCFFFYIAYIENWRLCFNMFFFYCFIFVLWNFVVLIMASGVISHARIAAMRRKSLTKVILSSCLVLRVWARLHKNNRREIELVTCWDRDGSKKKCCSNSTPTGRVNNWYTGHVFSVL